eukprot:TRINITY_DN43697_c0_g1_i1.p2 TRINITY_DN43697_c0_g1~~TRINITY_DN43697_c0_g1_i1.p2  ORF type:complete len:338 (+),score=148.66 TRINITY_DN43697_c0_g1_i1:95-1015(+)
MRAAAALLLLPALASGTATKKGLVGLDLYTFDKVIESQDAVLVKFDIEYPYGDKEDEWKKLAARVGRRKQAGLVIAEVGVQDYGEDKYNEKLRDRYGIKSGDYPAVRLFRRKTEQPAASFSGTFDEKGLADFIKEQLSIDLGEIKRAPKKDAPVAAGETRAEKPQYMAVASEEMSFLSGIYTLLDESHNSEPVWGLEDLRVFANNQGTWMLSDEANLKDDKGYVYSKQIKGGKWPSEHTEWLFYDGEQKEWVDANSTSVIVSGPPGLADRMPDLPTLALGGAAVLFALSIVLYFVGGDKEPSLPTN